jgi:hypothetical protein
MVKALRAPARRSILRVDEVELAGRLKIGLRNAAHETAVSNSGQYSAPPTHHARNRGMQMKQTITFAAAAMLLAACASPASAQQQLRPVEMKGTIEATSGGVISLKCDGKEVYLTVDPRKTKVECNGKAKASYLQPGLLVRFRGEFDKKGIAKEEISKLAIVSPSEENEPGLTADEIEGDDEKRKPKKDGGPLLVVGTIKQFKDGQLVVQAGGRAVRATLADDADLRVELDDYTLAEAGDKIQFKGRMAQQQQQDQGPAQAVGDEITITFTEPFEGDSKAKPKGKAGKAAKGTKSAPKKK